MAMFDGMTVKECWRALRITRRPEDHGGDNCHGAFGVFTHFTAPGTTDMIRFQVNNQGQDGLLVFCPSMEQRHPGGVRIYSVDDGKWHVFKLLREVEVEEGSSDVKVTAVTARVDPRTRP